MKEYAPITSVHFSPSKPHWYAVTAATRIQIYAPRTQKLTKTISRFKDITRSGCIRQDGKLLVAGDDSGLIQVCKHPKMIRQPAQSLQLFDINSRAILRTFDSHKQPVHVTKFSALSPTQILSCSDDTTVKLWDVPAQTAVTTFTEHTDYVRSGQISTTNPNLVLTGSYDSTVRLFDTRSGQCEMVMAPNSESHRTPVEQVLMFPSGTVALSSAGPILRVWDIVAGGRCTRALSNHQKTVTALTLTAKGDRLLTGSLDHMVKIYDVSTYQVVHTMRYLAPVLCLAISVSIFHDRSLRNSFLYQPDDTHVVGGMSDGTLSVRRREVNESGVSQSQLDPLSLLSEIDIGQTNTNQSYDIRELRLHTRTSKRLKEHDKMLKNFRYSAALDSVLKKVSHLCLLCAFPHNLT
jgi:U3 small nucleolar RNA-associated protein 15